MSPNVDLFAVFVLFAMGFAYLVTGNFGVSSLCFLTGYLYWRGWSRT